MRTGKGMAQDFQDAFMAGAEWQRKHKPDFRMLWEQSIQLPELHAFDDAPAKCPEGYRPLTGEEQDWLMANTEYSFPIRDYPQFCVNSKFQKPNSDLKPDSVFKYS